MVQTPAAQSRMQQERRRKAYKAACKRFDDEVWPAKKAALLQKAEDDYGPLDSSEKNIAYDIARGAYDSDTFLQLPDMSEQRRVLVEIAGFPAAASDFTDAQVKDLYKSHIKKVKKAMLEEEMVEKEIAAAIPVVIDEEDEELDALQGMNSDMEEE